VPSQAADAATLAREMVSGLLSGTPAPGPLPESLNGWRDVVEALQVALAEGGIGAVREAWGAMCRARPECAALIPPEREPVLTCLADVEPEPVGWLWEPYIPLRKLALLEGDPEAGKTWIALAIAAAVTRGAPWPGETSRRPAMRVLYLSAEDGKADTLRPRFDMLGGDPRQLYAFDGWREGDQTGPVSLRDVATVEKAIRQTGATLVIIDPLQAYLGASVDMHRANEVRPVLAALAELAERCGCAIVLIRHLSKAPQDRAIYRGLGSIDFAAAARSILLAGQDPRDPRRRVLLHAKSSLAPRGPSRTYTLDPGDQGLLWGDECTTTPDELFGPMVAGEERSALEEAKDFLREFLAGGPQPAKDVLKEARKAGISEKTLRRAQKDLVIARKSQADGQSWREAEWSWWLKPLPGHDGHLPTQSMDGHLITPENAQQNHGLTDTPLDGHMAIYQQHRNDQENQQVEDDSLDGHQQTVGLPSHDGQVMRRRCAGCDRLFVPPSPGKRGQLCPECVADLSPEAGGPHETA
jgi:hypothetical protein